MVTAAMNAIPRALFGLQQAPDQRDDAWRTYLGMPQQHNTFSESQYHPSQSTNPDQKYLKINNFWEQLASGQKKGLYSSEMAKTPPSNYQAAITNLLAKQAANEDRTAWVMGRYKKDTGKDATGNYISYYDKWDLDKNQVEGEYGRFGKPFEIYDRLYYDPTEKKIMWKPPVEKQGPPEARK